MDIVVVLTKHGIKQVIGYLHHGWRSRGPISKNMITKVVKSPFPLPTVIISSLPSHSSIADLDFRHVSSYIQDPVMHDMNLMSSHGS